MNQTRFEIHELHESKQTSVPRPLKKAEFDIRFGTTQAKRGWQDLLATKRNAIVAAKAQPMTGGN